MKRHEGKINKIIHYAVMCLTSLAMFATSCFAWFATNDYVLTRDLSMIMGDYYLRFDDMITVQRTLGGRTIQSIFKLIPEGEYKNTYAEVEWDETGSQWVFLTREVTNEQGTFEEYITLSLAGLMPGETMDFEVKLYLNYDKDVHYNLAFRGLSGKQFPLYYEDRETNPDSFINYNILGIYNVQLLEVNEITGQLEPVLQLDEATGEYLPNKHWFSDYDDAGGFRNPTIPSQVLFADGVFSQDDTDNDGTITLNFRVSVDLEQYRELQVYYEQTLGTDSIGNVLSEAEILIDMLQAYATHVTPTP